MGFKDSSKESKKQKREGDPPAACGRDGMGEALLSQVTMVRLRTYEEMTWELENVGPSADCGVK